MAVPKKKPSRTRSRRRSSTYDMKKQVKMLGLAVVKCHQCGEFKMSHAICRECGAYSANYQLDRSKKTQGKEIAKKAAAKKQEAIKGPQATRAVAEKAKAAQETKSTFFRRKAGGGGS